MELLLVAGLLAALNVTPLPMPPSWLVVVYLVVELDSNAAAIVIAAAIGTATGRMALAAWTRALGPRLMTRGTRENLDYLAERLRGRRSRAGVAGLLAISPPPSGALYTAAGLLRVNLGIVFGACLAGRLVTFGVAAAVAGTAGDEIAGRLRDAAGPWAVVLGLIWLAVTLWFLGHVDWRSTIERRRLRLRPLRAARAASPGGGPAPRG